MDAFTHEGAHLLLRPGLDEHLPLAAELLTDILLHPRFDAEELDREKSVVLQEIKMVEDTPDDIIHDIFASQVWEGHPLGRPILGTRELVTGFDRDAVAGTSARNMCRPRSSSRSRATSRTIRPSIPSAQASTGFSGTPVERTHTTPGLTAGVNIVHKQLEQVHVVMGFSGLRSPIPGGTRCSCSTTHRRQHVVAPLPGSA